MSLFFDLSNLRTVCLGCSEKGVIFCDPNVLVYGRHVADLLNYELLSAPLQKTREVKQALEDELMKKGYGRDTAIVAIGGGTVTDLVGFLASTYMRGVPLFLIPTTLLAMVDAAIGGKTGLDTPFGKNLIGSFYPAKAIWIEPSFLSTLPESEMKNGRSEILKYGLIWDQNIWESEDLHFLIRASIACKCQIVEQDPFEKGLRRILNFGHTVGHALESMLKLPHGKAVALGCVAESFLSFTLGYLSQEDFDRIKERFKDEVFPDFDRDVFLQKLSMDKKAKKGEPRFVLIDRIGKCVDFNGEYCRSVEQKNLNEMIDWTQSKLNQVSKAAR